METKMHFLCEGLEAYLSPEAASIVSTLVQAGLDRDLAFEMVAADESCFDLPKDSCAASLEARCDRVK